MGASSLGEGFYGKRKMSLSSQGARGGSGSGMMMMGIQETVEAPGGAGVWPSLAERYPMAPFISSATTNIPAPPTTPTLNTSSSPYSPTRDPLADDPHLKRSLVHLFFATFSDPLASIFHRPTFFARLAEGRVEPVLLNVIYAWAARVSDHPSLVGEGERWARGERYAQVVRRWLDGRAWAESGELAEREEVERAQAMCLMVVYEGLVGRGERVASYLGQSLCHTDTVFSPTKLTRLSCLCSR